MDMMTRFEYAEDVHADGEFVPFSDRNAERRAFAAIAGTDEIQEAALEGGQGVTLIEAWRAAGRPARFTLRQPGRPAEMEVADLSEEDARALFE